MSRRSEIGTQPPPEAQAPRPRRRWLSRSGAVLADQSSRYGRLMRLDRPIGFWLLLWPTLWALWIAGAGRPDEKVFIVFVLGTLVMRSAGCIINDFADRDIDPHVRRTSRRPLATGEVTPAEALILFFALMLIGLGLVMSLNTLTVQLAIAGAVLTVVYPFMKRFVSAPQFVLGIAFAWGVPMAFAAQLGEIPRVGWLLFVVTVIWVVLYDTEYAMVDREDDIKIGVRSSAILFADMDRVAIAGLFSLFFLGLALLGQSAELGRWYYGGMAAAVIIAVYQLFLIKDREPLPSFNAFLSNAWLGAAVFAGMLLDYVFSG